MSATSFYVTGGTLPPGTPSYVERQADKDLYEGLTRGEFCYVLTSRQMGKSSLMAQTTARLREAGVTVVNLDLTRLGQNLTVEQWYDGLLGHLGRQLDLEDELEEFWLEHQRLSPLQCWLGALQEVVLARIPERLVIAVDEIDTVRSLSFSTDEFFAAIRDCYNRRSQDPEFGRLTFCLLGVATPSDLIQDTRTTPFNIGKRIELTDFTEAETAPLARGLWDPTPPPAPPRDGEGGRPSLPRGEEGSHAPPSLGGKGAGGLGPAAALLQRILYWTGGHPYLTQRLCQAVAQDGTVQENTGVDRRCEELFLSASAREKDDNLLFVRERLLNSEAGYLPEGEVRAGLLDLYAQVRRGQRVPDDEMDPFVGILRLSGIVRAVDGRLQVRNRIYGRVFDPEWVTAHMPGAELRRQREAFRRGVWRTAAVGAVILAAMGGLALTAVDQAHRADQQRHVAEAQREEARRNLYAAQLNLAQQAEEEGNPARALDILEAQRPEPGQEDLRGFEWRYLWRHWQEEALFTFPRQTGAVFSVDFSPDGRMLASGGSGSTIRLWDTDSRQEIATLQLRRGAPVEVYAVAFSPDGKLLASGDGFEDDESRPGEVRLWDVSGYPAKVGGREIATLKGHTAAVDAVVFSPDGKTLASGSADKTVKLWSVPAGSTRAAVKREITTLKPYTGWWHSLAFSPDGRTLATGTADGPVRLWDVESRRQVGTLTGHTGGLVCLNYSPDGHLLASGSVDNTVRLWSVAKRRAVATFPAQRDVINAVEFSPDGKMLATGSADTTVKLWNVATRQELATLRGHTRAVSSVAFSPDGQTLATGSHDSTVKLWNPAAKESITVLRQKAPVWAVAFSPDGRALATGNGDRTVRLWDAHSGHETAILQGHTAPVASLTFSPDGKILASGSEDHTVRLWSVATRQLLASLPDFKGGRGALAFSPDGKTLAMQGSAAVKLWVSGDPGLTANRDSRSAAATRRHAGWTEVANLKWEPGNWWLAFSPDGKVLATAAGRNKVTLWDVATRRMIAVLKGWNYHPIAFSPSGSPRGGSWTFATASIGGTPELWDLATGHLASLRGHQGGPWQFSPDGKTFAVCASNTIYLWNLTLRREVVALQGHGGVVNDVAFSPDGSTLASGSSDGTVRLWHAASFQDADPLRIILTSASDRTVVIQWRPVPWAVGYNVYRGPAEARHPQLVNLTPRPLTAARFTDQSPGLVNGRPQSYAVAPLFRQSAEVTEGPRATRQATPAALPAGWIGTSMNEGERAGSAAYDPASGVITLRGSGADLTDRFDGGYFLHRPVTGDFQLTVRMLTRPAGGTHPHAKAGPMIRESLDPGSRDAYLAVHRALAGLRFLCRIDPEAFADGPPASLPFKKERLPIVLRLTRRGDTITAHYSTDEGRSFQTATDPLTFNSPLPMTVYAGLAITAHDESQISEARFSDLRIEKR